MTHNIREIDPRKCMTLYRCAKKTFLWKSILQYLHILSSKINRALDIILVKKNIPNAGPD